MKSLSHVRLFATPWTVAYLAPLSMGFSQQRYWSGLPFPSSQPRGWTQISHIAGKCFTIWATGKPSMWDECNCASVWTFFGIAFFGTGMKTDLFQSCAHCWIFPICCHIECSPFTASSFRIWNNSAGIPSPPLTLFIVMVPKAHLTSHSRMSGSRRVITPSAYLGHEGLFCTVLLCVLATSS